MLTVTALSAGVANLVEIAGESLRADVGVGITVILRLEAYESVDIVLAKRLEVRKLRLGVNLLIVVLDALMDTVVAFTIVRLTVP